MHSRDKKPGSYLSRRSFLAAALCGLPVLTLPFCRDAQAATAPNCSFVYVNDVHLTSGVPDNAFKMLQESQLFLQDIIKGINALKPDFVIFGGDQVETVGNNDANWQFFIDIMQGLNCPWYFVLGEQDVSGKTPVDKMREFGPDFKGRGLTSNAPYWSCDPVPNLHLVGLDSSQANNTSGDISGQQLDWLKKDLQSNRGKFTVVVTHHPLLAPPPYDGGPPLDEYTLVNGSDVREILGGSTDVRLVLSGHLYMNKVQIERDVYHVSCAGLNIYPCQYKFFRISKDSITMESFEVPLPKLIKKAQAQLVESNLASRLNRRKPEAITQLFEGAPEDQNASLSLGPTKSVRTISKKQLKEDQERRAEALEKEAEALKNKSSRKTSKNSSRNSGHDSKKAGESASSSAKDSKSDSASVSGDADSGKEGSAPKAAQEKGPAEQAGLSSAKRTKSSRTKKASSKDESPAKSATPPEGASSGNSAGAEKPSEENLSGSESDKTTKE